MQKSPALTTTPPTILPDIVWLHSVAAVASSLVNAKPNPSIATKNRASLVMSHPLFRCRKLLGRCGAKGALPMPAHFFRNPTTAGDP
jgi:hypothetical protein